MSQPGSTIEATEPGGMTRDPAEAGAAGILEAGDGARTHDPQLGKLMLYQLSYTRAVRAL